MSEILCRLDHAGLFLPGDTERKPILRDITWDIHAGEHSVLIGGNGAGKSTLLRLIHGEAWTTEGSVSWNSEGTLDSSRITGLSVSALVSPAQQQLFQKHGWDITGLELLLTGFDGSHMRYTPGDEAKVKAAVEMARRLDALPLLDRSIRTMSQGQLRLLLLGRALVRRPRLLLLDESTDGLDGKHREIFDSVLKDAAQESTVIMATHRESRIPSWCRVRLYMQEGRLGHTPPATEHQISAAPVQKRAVPVPSGPLIEVRNADVYIEGGETPVLYGITWSLQPGEHWLLKGGNGSGKSTFLRLLAGDEIVAWPGDICFHFPEVRAGEIPLENIRRHVRLVSDLSEAYYDFDVTCLELVLSGFDNTVGLYRTFSDGEVEEARMRLGQMGLSALADTSIRRISTGQARRLFLARALAGGPSVLLLDEPCSGLDIPSRDAYLQALDALAAGGMQYVFVSHYEEDAPSSADRVAQMKDGHLTVLR